MIIQRFSVLCVSLIFFALLASGVSAVTLSASVTGTGDGDTVNISVSGNPNSNVVLTFVGTDLMQNVRWLGQTNSAGYLTTKVSTAALGITAYNSMAITVSGNTAIDVVWPYISAVPGNVMLSQTGEALAVGQMASLRATGLNLTALNLSGNSNSSVASVVINGTQLTVTAIKQGQTTMTFCDKNYSNQAGCADLFVVVTPINSSALSFDQNPILIVSGQTVKINISGGTGSYQVVSQNPDNIVNANISGSALSLSARGSFNSTALAICSTDMNTCGIVNAKVSKSSPTVTFSPSITNIKVGDTATVTVAGGLDNTGNYKLTANSNINVVSASLTNNTVTLTGQAVGYSTITVCPLTGICGSFYVSVGGSAVGDQAAGAPSHAVTSGHRLLKLASGPAIYDVDATNLRRMYANAGTFWSWHVGDWSTNPAAIISQADFDATSVGRNLTARPGSLIKFENSPSIYAVTGDNQICRIESESVAQKLYGANWKSRLINVQAAFEADYQRTSNCMLSASSPYPDGSLIQYQNSTDIWYLQNGKRRLLTSFSVSQNNFNLNNLIRNVANSNIYPIGDAVTGTDTSIFNLK